MPETLNLSTLLPGPPEKIYTAWLDSNEHGLFTGSPANIDPQIGGEFTAWDGYIQGKTLELEPGKRILQSWRTTEFPDTSPDSLLEVIFEPDPAGTRLTLLHTNIPDGQSDQYRQGWLDYYFQPMREYFS